MQSHFSGARWVGFGSCELFSFMTVFGAVAQASPKAQYAELLLLPVLCVHRRVDHRELVRLPGLLSGESTDQRDYPLFGFEGPPIS
jgi:hypothetical protein